MPLANFPATSGARPPKAVRMIPTIASRYYPTDIEYIMDRGYLEYVLKTVQMAYLGALFGLLASVPLGWFESFNMSPSRRYVYPIARFITMGCRAVHVMIWAILFVTIIGFGMLPGVLALTFFCTGFAGKLFAEEIEAIDMGQVDAMRASGANLFQIMLFGVFPQVRVAFRVSPSIPGTWLSGRPRWSASSAPAAWAGT